MRIFSFVALFLFLSHSNAQGQEPIVDYTINQDTIRFKVSGSFNNLIIGKLSPVLSKDSLISFLLRCYGVETPSFTNKKIYASMVGTLDSGKISFIVKNGQKYVYQYNDGKKDVLKNGSGISKLFYEPLGRFTYRVYRDSMLVTRYTVFGKDTLYHLSVFGAVSQKFYDYISANISFQMSNNGNFITILLGARAQIFIDRHSAKDLFIVTSENKTINFLLASSVTSSKRLIKKIRISKAGNLYLDFLPAGKKCIWPLLDSSDSFWSTTDTHR